MFHSPLSSNIIQIYIYMPFVPMKWFPQVTLSPWYLLAGAEACLAISDYPGD